MDTPEREKATHRPDLPHPFESEAQAGGEPGKCLLCGRSKDSSLHQHQQTEHASAVLEREKGS